MGGTAGAVGAVRLLLLTGGGGGVRLFADDTLHRRRGPFSLCVTLHRKNDSEKTKTFQARPLSIYPLRRF